MDTKRDILEYLHYHPQASRNDITTGLQLSESEATVKRMIAAMVADCDIVVEGQGRSTRYCLSTKAQLLLPYNIDTYFAIEADQRQVQTTFNFDLINSILPSGEIFTTNEMAHLNELQALFRNNIIGLSPQAYQKEIERLGIDLSWKSSQIEGNTYSLLETERLLREKLTANGKTREEATMLLNHKAALDFVIANPDFMQTLTVRGIDELHSLLVQDLSVQHGIRSHRVGITGTNYRPLDNEFQIREALEDTCCLINSRTNVFDKALLALMLLSYIQAFEDGNKRTARIVSNAILIAYGCCPLSFRTVDSIDYKKALLIFYEQNSLHAFKQLFIGQYEFAVKEYF